MFKPIDQTNLVLTATSTTYNPETGAKTGTSVTEFYNLNGKIVPSK